MRAAIASGGCSSRSAIYSAVLAEARSIALAGDVLDFGAGTGTLIDALLRSAPHLKLTGADLLPRPGSLPERVSWIEADLNDPLPLPGSAFDAIVSVEVI